MTKKLLFALTLTFSLLAATIGYAATSDVTDEIIYDQTLKQIYGNDFEAPFLSSTQGETVDESSGALHIKQTDLSLSGRNGLDLNIMRRFNSQKTNKVITNFSSGRIYHRPNMLKYKYSFYNPKTEEMDEC